MLERKEMRGTIKQGLTRIFGVRGFGHLRFSLYVAEATSKILVGEERECNVCGLRSRFRSFGHPPRYGAQCPNCLSLERHRLFKLWVDENQEFIRGRTILHFAPEKSVSSFLKDLAGKYISADLTPHYADVILNIEKIALGNESIDIVVASHVLEHVNDREALEEIRRILTPTGVAVIMVPIVEGWDDTYEDPAVVGAKDRVKHFGQWDHVRFYGRDLRNRIRAAGYRLDEVTATEPDVQRYGLQRGEKVFLAYKT
jgi:SAM-dependent methyltransferase